MVGAVIQDRYRINKKLGRGAFATVYKAADLKMNRDVAIKLLEEVGDESGFRIRFLREAESMGKLNHPNIATVYDFAEHKGRPFIVMELVEGPTLLHLVSRSPLTLPQICNIGAQICEGMAYAHKQGIVHRDLKLQNIMISEEDGEQRVKILDFNLAKLIFEDMQSSSKGIKGTPYYLAPEQIRGESVDGRADIFAFGVGLYRIVNGSFPFEAEHPTALMYLILNKFDIDFAETVNNEMREIIVRCLEKDARARAQDFDQLAAEFREMRRLCEDSRDEMGSTVPNLGVFVERSSKRNPYLNRVMIKHPAEFFGREREIRKIYSRLDAPHPQSISVVGERRIGKSSLLNFVYHPRNRKTHMQHYGSSIFAYLDFQRESDYDVPKFIDFLMNMFSYESKNGKDYAQRERSLDELKAVVQELNEKGQRIIILMDEFERITKNERFHEHFFSFLRSLANSYDVAYVTSSYEDLQRLCHNKDISDSPFFNIFSNLPLRPFTRDEALELIVEPSRKEGVPLEPHAGKIVELAGCFPLFLQIGCSSVFEYLVDDPKVEPDWTKITRTFLDEVEQHFEFIWEKMDEPARDNLCRTASGKPINRQYKFVNDELERRGYLIESDDGLKVFSSVFQEFVLRQGECRKSGFLSSLFGRKR